MTAFLSRIKNVKITRRRCLFSVIPAIVAAFLLEAGRILQSGESLHAFGPGNLLRVLAYALVLIVLLFFLFGLDFKSKETGCLERTRKKFRAKYFLLIWLAVFVCYIPAFLAYYPTIWAYDVYAQVPSISGMVPTTLHPLLHTLFIDTIVQIGHEGDNYETGMALLSLIQMLIMSGIFSYAIEIAYTWGCKRPARILLFVFFAIFPVNSILSVSMTKDVLFSGCLLVCCLKLYDMIDCPDSFYHSWGKIVTFILFTCLMLSLRNQAIYVFAVVMVVGLVLFKRKNRIRFLLIGLAGIVAFFGLQVGLYNGMNAEKGPSKEAYAVPMQCLFGTAILHPELIPEYGEGELLYGLVPRDAYDENLENNFKPYLVDPVKELWPDDVDTAALLKTWVRYGLKYPVDYATIWGNLTRGAWYPFDTSHANIYESERQGYLLSDFKILYGMNLERPASKWPALENLYEKIATENVHQNIPVVSLLFAPATYCWIMLFAILLCLYRKRFEELLPLGFLFFYWGTILLGPTVIVRYVYPIIVTIPLVLCRMKLPAKKVPAGD